jgi:threonine dehydrogenase-like Zn-dependent dehydrogenase
LLVTGAGPVGLLAGLMACSGVLTFTYSIIMRKV